MRAYTRVWDIWARSRGHGPYVLVLGRVGVCLWVYFILTRLSSCHATKTLRSFWTRMQVGLASLHASRHRAAATLVAAELGTHERGIAGMDEEFLHLALSR